MQFQAFINRSLTFLLLVLMCGASLHASTKYEQSQPLSEVLKQISEKYEVIITFSNKQVEQIRLEFILQEEESLELAINRALQRTNLKYRQVSEAYFVVYQTRHRGREVDRLLTARDDPGNLDLASATVVRPQAHDPASRLAEVASSSVVHRLAFPVSGTVTDGDGLPLIGVTVLEKATGSGTVTDIDGNFTISVTDENAVLEVSYIGFQRQTIEVGGRSTIDVQLAVEVASLESVVVVGYGTRRKQDVTGSVVSVQPEDFTEGANYSAVQLLNGAASGVNISQTNSAPGAGLKVQIRGAGSINSSNGVLFVVDGLPGVDPNSLSPGDIASIDVLKDASAAAIYGTRAANGVVLITTKRGKSGKPVLNYSSYYGTQTPAKTLDVLGARDYAELVNSRTPDTYSPEQVASFGEGTDWQDVLFQNAPVQNHQLSLSGGSEAGNYYLGLNYFDQEGIVRTSGTQKYNIRLNVEASPLDRLKLSANANYTRQTFENINRSIAANENAGPINSAVQFDPTLAVGLDANGRYQQNTTIALDNPLALINGFDQDVLENRFYASVNADYNIFDALTATLRLGAESNTNRQDTYRNRLSIRGLAAGGLGDIDYGQQTHWLAEALLTYKQRFDEQHDLSLLAGITFEEFLSDGFGAASQGFLSDVTGTNLLQSGDGDIGDNVNSGRSKNQLNGILGRVTYGFRDKYLLTASVRIDGSSRFAEGNKYAVFPSASVAWILTEEPFLAGSGLIDNLKLRLGYGELGNQGIDNFETRQTLVAQGSAVFGGSILQGVRPARLPNPNLTWETTREINFGIDYALADYLITGSVDFFRRSTEDQLFQKPLPSVVGFTSVRTNLGSVRNSGVDFSIRSRNIRKETFTWSTNLTLSYLKNEVTELPDFTEEIISGNVNFISSFLIVREGVPLSSFYGYEIDGIFQTGDDIAASPTPDARPGEPRFVDQNGDGEVTAEDRVILGDPFPDVTFGLSNTFSMGRFGLDVLVLGVEGVETLDANVLESLYPTNDARNVISRYYTDRWTEANPSNELPSGVDPSRYGGARSINSLTVVDASYIRLKNVTLSYTFNLGNSTTIRSLRLYGAVDNLATITEYAGYDPEASTNTGVARIAYNSYPLARTYRFGVDLQF